MKKILISVFSFALFSFYFSLSADAGTKKRVECRTLDVNGMVLANGNRCDFGWTDCISNECPHPDGTRVEYDGPSIGD
ncbi:hypothetical protein [Algoriphagus pacificus]|uniref:NVEALA protein n=1 Tax=Algoriphagus pacificus TaxID=2811234 RepID=A0ABS3CL43_9BACT|nr:hypothetical protein [Algoriphagus pacificus]MBN7817792.1 hypothetical protein [Algoriphagus pacificus]